ncbi:glycosyltransferase family 1 protein [Priestia aryabhattai]|uniref:glycosyltransferase n=1 Tax=Priestia aryabhattai TaxID=412384 RepID=UPI001C8E2BA7|nr:glycosyltransferase [Priestia aryabhattai]MBX9968380.1 glycosyltransferase family 1 protein [Priestia aryabhattai]
MINLLFIAADTSNSLDKNFYFLENELAKLTNLTIWRKSGRIDNILNKITTKPDYILLLNDIGSQMSPIIKGLFSINIPIGLIVNDVHRFTELRRHYIKKNNIRHIFSIARDKFFENYPEYSDRMEWIPHFINTGIYKDYALKKDISLLLMGAISDVYPLRQKILQFYKNEPTFVYHQHPGYEEIDKTKTDLFHIGEKYAKEINKAKIFFTCPSIFNYPVMKYYEALACRSLLLAPTFKELEDLGFIPGIHFVAINEYNFKEKADHYLNNDLERRKITDQGYKFVHQNHSIQVRAQQLVEQIQKRGFL